MNARRAVLSAVLVLAACARAATSKAEDRPAASPDTVVGIVRISGADPSTFVAVQPASGRALRVSGDASTTLRQVPGTEVWIAGARTAEGFRADSFEVRQANGVPVDDGIVSLSAGTLTLRTRSGAQRAIPDASDALRALAGARIWVTRPEPNRAPTYGVISRP
jgi:hypothetical protein